MKPHSWIVNIARGVADRHRRARRRRCEAERSAARRSTSPTPSRCRTATRCGTSPRALITPHVANPPATMDRDLAKRVTENVRRFARRRGPARAGRAPIAATKAPRPAPDAQPSRWSRMRPMTALRAACVAIPSNPKPIRIESGVRDRWRRPGTRRRRCGSSCSRSAPLPAGGPVTCQPSRPGLERRARAVRQRHVVEEHAEVLDRPVARVGDRDLDGLAGVLVEVDRSTAASRPSCRRRRSTTPVVPVGVHVPVAR